MDFQKKHKDTRNSRIFFSKAGIGAAGTASADGKSKLNFLKAATPTSGCF